ncbi:MAG: serpin family protein [Anaerolineales bacterium]
MKRSLVFCLGLLLLAALFSGAACSPRPAPLESRLSRDLAPAVLPADRQTLVAGNNAFALGLYTALRGQDGNLTASPYSISLALAMTRAGAAGETARQMDSALHFDLPPERLHPAFNALDLELASRSQAASDEAHPLQLNIANAVWAQQDHPFRSEYLDLLALNYGAAIFPADFVGQAEPARLEINRWVSDETEGKIRDLLAPGALDASTRMVLVNAIYFKADWQTPFDPNDTYEAPFYLLDGSQVQVAMMHNELTLPYLRGDNFQAVELPYAGGTAAMTIIVPDAGQFAAFEAAFDPAAYEAILAQMQPTEVQLGLPKFTFRSQFDLAQTLAAMGMPAAFDPGQADFSGMDGARDLYISNVVHQAFIAVDEKGTEAAAATAVIMALSAVMPQGIPLEIDRPFLFVIRDLPTGQILFIGRVLNPGE